MREWNRATTRSDWDALPGDALGRYVEQHGCADLADGLLACVETVSEPSKRRRFGKDSAARRTVIAVTARYLVWGSTDAADAFVAAARLSDIAARDYRSELIEDSGLEIVGFRLGGNERESWFLPLGDGVDAREFRGQLDHAIDPAAATQDQ